MQASGVQETLDRCMLRVYHRDAEGAEFSWGGETGTLVGAHGVRPATYQGRNDAMMAVTSLVRALIERRGSTLRAPRGEPVTFPCVLRFPI